jgi:hypothetical protein
MSPNQPTQSDPSPQCVPVDDADVTDSSKREIALVKCYQKLTGENESHARNAFMYIFRDDEQFNADLNT